MEPNLKASIINTAAGIMGLAGGLLSAWGFLIALAIPTVVEVFTNKLLFYALLMAGLSFFALHTFSSVAISQFRKAIRRWKEHRKSK